MLQSMSRIKNDQRDDKGCMPLWVWIALLGGCVNVKPIVRTLLGSFLYFPLLKSSCYASQCQKNLFTFSVKMNIQRFRLLIDKGQKSCEGKFFSSFYNGVHSNTCIFRKD